MNDVRARRTAVLAAAARAKSEAKAAAADQALRRLVKRGEPVTFQSVQRRPACPTPSSTGTPTSVPGSSVSVTRPARNQSPPAGTASDNTIIQALTSQITHLKKQHRDETQALRPHSSKPTARTWNCGASSPAWDGTRNPQRRSNVASIATTI